MSKKESGPFRDVGIESIPGSRNQFHSLSLPLCVSLSLYRSASLSLSLSLSVSLFLSVPLLSSSFTSNLFLCFLPPVCTCCIPRRNVFRRHIQLCYGSESSASRLLIKLTTGIAICKVIEKAKWRDGIEKVCQR
jgi:hypothetical protein